MKSCPSCGKANRDNSRFCNSCGWRLDFVAHCPTCGSINAGNSAFCNDCGAPLTGATSAPPALAPQAMVDVHPAHPTNGTSAALPTNHLSAPSVQLADSSPVEPAIPEPGTDTPVPDPFAELVIEEETAPSTPGEVAAEGDVVAPDDDSNADSPAGAGSLDALPVASPEVTDISPAEAPTSPFAFDWSAIPDPDSSPAAEAGDVAPASSPDDRVAAPLADLMTGLPDAPHAEPAAVAAESPNANWLEAADADVPTELVQTRAGSTSEPAIEKIEDEPAEEIEDPTAGIRIARSLSVGRPPIRTLPAIAPLSTDGATFATIIAAPLTPLAKSRPRIAIPQWLLLTILIVALAIVVAVALRMGVGGLGLIDVPALADAGAGHVAWICQMLV
jgi:hypothetical protein